MPTYEYACDACEHNFEEFQSMTEEALTKCPACGKKKLRRLFGAGAGFIFKGSGFYQTDYRSESYKAAAKADEPKAPAADKSATTDTTSTPAPSTAASKPKVSGKSAKSET